jgi:hypothetical protein
MQSWHRLVSGMKSVFGWCLDRSFHFPSRVPSVRWVGKHCSSLSAVSPDAKKSRGDTGKTGYRARAPPLPPVVAPAWSPGVLGYRVWSVCQAATGASSGRGGLHRPWTGCGGKGQPRGGGLRSPPTIIGSHWLRAMSSLKAVK